MKHLHIDSHYSKCVAFTAFAFTAPGANVWANVIFHPVYIYAFFVVLLVLKSVVSDFHAKSVVSDFHADHAGNFRFFFVVFVFCVGEINRK